MWSINLGRGVRGTSICRDLRALCVPDGTAGGAGNATHLDALLVHKGFHSADDASESLSSLETVRTSKALEEPEFATFQVKKYLNIAASIPHWNLISFLHEKSLERTSRANTFSAVRVNPGLCIV
jgi:hypothetical protein